MRRLPHLSGLLVSVGLAVTGVAAPPPPIPTVLLPLPVAGGAPLDVTPPTPILDPAGPITEKQLASFGGSSVIYDALRQQLARSASLSAEPIVDPLSSTRTHRAQVDAYANGTLNATSDNLQDAEPTVSAVSIGGVMHTITVTNDWSLGRARLQAIQTTDFVSTTKVTLSLPSGYTWAGDPFLAANQYSGGIAPKRMYCVGLLFNDTTFNAPSAIGVWHSDDGGQTWSAPAIVTTQPGSGYMLDKPALTVSWHTGSLGYLYVTYIVYNKNNVNSSSIWVARSTDGGATFPTQTVLAYDNVEWPQVVVNTSSGAVSAIWANLRYADVRMSTSTDYGATFGPHEIAVDAGNLIINSTLNGNIRANSIPMARYNWAAGRICLVYYARGSAGSDIYYTYKPGCTNCNYYGWEHPHQLNDISANDQFMPAIDFNTSGNLIVPFYDRRNDPNNLLYQEYAAYITPNGTSLQANFLLNALQSNPLNAGSGTPNIGDYQDAWDANYPTGESVTSAWIAVPGSGPSEDYLTRIFY